MSTASREITRVGGTKSKGGGDDADIKTAKRLKNSNIRSGIEVCILSIQPTMDCSISFSFLLFCIT